MEPSGRQLGLLVAALAAASTLLPAAAQAESLHVVFPQSAEVTVVQGTAADFTLEVQALGATRCDATTAAVRIDSIYSVDAVGDIASGLPADMPIETDKSRGTSENCYIKNPVRVPLTATAAIDTPIGDYKSVIRYGKGGDGGVDLDGPPLTIHVVAPPAAPPEVLPPPQLAPPQLAPPELLVLPERVEAPKPVLGKSVMLTPVRGKVTFQVPGQAAAPLTKTVIVANNTVVDTDSGVVKVTVARDKTGALDSVDAWGGGFKAVQGVESNGRGLTTFTLAGGVVAPKNAARSAKAASKRSLWVNGKGNFKTRGKRASAIVRGTYWLTEESSAGTKVSVKRGLVAVRDLVKHQTVLVSAGHSYTANVPTRIARRVPAFTGRVR
jgi:hypothetical protein